jgi:thiamine monophosphate synthase
MNRWQGMADDPDTMRARLDRLTELVELARQVPWEDHGHVERALHLISQALQKVAQVAQVRSQNQDEARLGEEAEFAALCRQIEEMCRLTGVRIQNDRSPK